MNISLFQDRETPFYYYDKSLLHDTLQTIAAACSPYPHFEVHYAVKANNNAQILSFIAAHGLGADCVSGGEVRAAIEAGFPAEKIVFAGVGKTDKEIALALAHDIFCFNVESVPELEVIASLAKERNQVARVAFRINPNIGAHTHANITTGLSENKFGISMEEMESIIRRAEELENIRFIGLHFHIGSQILEMDDFIALCNRINQLQDQLEVAGILPEHINVGGGLGIDYLLPDQHPIPQFREYFSVYAQHLRLRDGQTVHFELGRAIVGQCGSLITCVTYVKKTSMKQFAIVDAGMTELIRPALYGAYHQIDHLTSSAPAEVYDVVGPICESSDVFRKDVLLPATQRGDLLAIRSAGAYGEVMASRYNSRDLPHSYLE